MLRKLLSLQCFINVREKINKSTIVFLEGDCEKPDLGLSENDKNELICNTNIIIHAAANVKFDQPLRVAANINVRSTIDLFNIGKKMTHLKVRNLVLTFSNKNTLYLIYS